MTGVSAGLGAGLGAGPGGRRLTITVLPGDGIGPEVVAQARKVLDAAAPALGVEVGWKERPFGGQAIDLTGTPLPEETLASCLESDATLLGAVGGPRWDRGIPPERRPEAGLLALRRGLGVFANLRPIRASAAVFEASPLRPEVLDGSDVMVVRELTGGLYFGPRGRTPGPPVKAHDTLEYTEEEIERVVRLAFRLAMGRRRRLTSVDKANVLETSRLWRETVERVHRDFASVEVDHLYVDAAAMELVRHPGRFDVLVTENLMGDVLTDLGSVLAGSIGLLPSASLGPGGRGLYEPIHGSAPDIAGRGIANPLGAILSVALMCRWSLGLPELAEAIEAAVDGVLTEGYRTPDLAGPVSAGEPGERIHGPQRPRAGVVLVDTEQMGDLVAWEVAGRLGRLEASGRMGGDERAAR